MASADYQKADNHVFQMQLLKRMNSYVLWPLSSAARVLSKQLSSPNGKQRSTYHALDLLYTTMHILDDDSGSWDHLLAEIGEQLSELNMPRQSRSGGDYDILSIY